MSQDPLQGLYTLRALAEQANDPNADPRQIMQHLIANADAMNQVQQHFSNLQEAVHQHQHQAAPLVSLSAAIETLTNQQREQQQLQHNFQVNFQTVLDRLNARNHGHSRAPIPLPLSPKFKGTTEEFTFAEFRAKLTTVAQRFPDSMSTDRDKINYAIQSMEGPPARFFAPYINGEIADVDGLLDDYDLFMHTVDEFHGDRQEQDEVDYKLARLRQSGSMMEYISQFRTLSARSGWNEQALLARFKDGLSPDVKNILLAQWSKLRTVKELQAAATNAYQNLQTHQRQRPRNDQKHQMYRRPATVPVNNSQANPNAMEVDALRTKRLTPEEKQRRRDLGLCLYCGGKDHYANACPAKGGPIQASVVSTAELENEMA